MQWSLWKFIASVMFGMRQTSNLEGWTCPFARFKLFEKVIGIPSTSPQGSPVEIWGLISSSGLNIRNNHPNWHGPSKTKTPGWYWQSGDRKRKRSESCPKRPRKYVGQVWRFWGLCFRYVLAKFSWNVWNRNRYLYWPTLQLSLYMSTWSFEADN